MNMYRKAILSQSACNVSGLVHDLANLMDEIWKEEKEVGGGTEFVNTHPVVRLFAEQISFLAVKENNYRDYSEAYKICQEKSDEKENEDGLVKRV